MFSHTPIEFPLPTYAQLSAAKNKIGILTEAHFGSDWKPELWGVMRYDAAEFTSQKPNPPKSQSQELLAQGYESIGFYHTHGKRILSPEDFGRDIDILYNPSFVGQREVRVVGPKNDTTTLPIWRSFLGIFHEYQKSPWMMFSVKHDVAGSQGRTLFYEIKNIDLIEMSDDPRKEDVLFVTAVLDALESELKLRIPREHIEPLTQPSKIPPREWN